MANQETVSLGSNMNRIIRKIKIRSIVIVILTLIAGYTHQTNALTFKSDLDFTDVPRLLGFLILISLFVERTIEFILSLWRSAEADRMDRQIEKLNKDIIQAGDDIENEKIKLQQLDRELKEAEDERSEYRSVSRLAALWTGMVIGVIVALTGVRILGSIFEVTCISEIHKSLFIMVDILLTGCVLAGGSEAINKIMKVYNSFMTKAVKSNKPE